MKIFITLMKESCFLIFFAVLYIKILKKKEKLLKLINHNFSFHFMA